VKFNLAYFGPEPLFHLRRDFLLVVKYGLESLGHDVNLSGLQLDTTRFNLIVGAYFLPVAELRKLQATGLDFAHVNTEVIAGDMLNFNPAKTDFLGAYLPSLRAGRFIWEAVIDNMPEHARYGNRAHFLRWGWHPKLEDIEHRPRKDLDFYFFGLMSARRQAIVKELFERRLIGIADHSCPYFLRNDRIARAKVHLNIAQDDKYTHVNAFRVCYLVNNRCSVVSEAENDPAGYLSVTKVVAGKEQIADAIADLVADDKWKAFGAAAYDRFAAQPMTQSLERLLDESFASAGRAVPAGAGL
jgi:hypothetical protein